MKQPIKNIRLSQSNLKVVQKLMNELDCSFNKALNILIERVGNGTVNS